MLGERESSPTTAWHGETAWVGVENGKREKEARASQRERARERERGWGWLREAWRK